MAGTGGGGTAHSMLKPLLPFSVTPPRQNGPSEAERKIEALTKQLEEELEMEEESEYFGKTEFVMLLPYVVMSDKLKLLSSQISMHRNSFSIYKFDPQTGEIESCLSNGLGQ